MFRVIFSMATIFSLLSCAAHYVEPSSGEKSVLVLPTKSSSYKFLGGFSGATVSFAIKGENGCGKIYRQITPKNKEDTDVEVVIPGNKDIFVVFTANSGNMVCNVAGSFRAEADKKYKVVNIGGGYKCAIGVAELVDESTIIELELKRAYPDSFSGTTICENR